MKMLGQHDAEQDQSRQAKNTVIIDLLKQKYSPHNERIIEPQVTSIEELQLPEEIRTVLNNIRLQDNDFDFDRFIHGVRRAYSMYFQAMQEKNWETLKNLLDLELFQKIKDDVASSRAESSIKPAAVLHIDTVKVIDAALFGDRAMLTVEINGHLSGDNTAMDTSSICHKTTFCRYLLQERMWKITKIIAQ